jgi:hypothetical protein
MLDKVKKLVEEFEQVQDYYNDFGAYDSEPQAVFQCLLRKGFEGKDVVVPKTGYGWELYTRTMDCEEPAAKLCEKASEVVNAVIEARGNEEVMEFLENYCWR